MTSHRWTSAPHNIHEVVYVTPALFYINTILYFLSNQACIGTSIPQWEVFYTSNILYIHISLSISRDFTRNIISGHHGPFTRYAKLRAAHAPGMPGTFSPPPTSKKTVVSDLGMHHGTCVRHVPWCMSGSPTRGVGGGGETFPAFPAHAQPAILRIWQQAHVLLYIYVGMKYDSILLYRVSKFQACLQGFSSIRIVKF